MNPIEPEAIVNYETLVLEKVRMMARTHVTPQIFESVSLDAVGLIADNLVQATLNMMIPAKKDSHSSTREFPVTWWDAVKKRFFPRLGFKTEVVEITRTEYHACPHLLIECHRDAHSHWLRNGGGRA